MTTWTITAMNCSTTEQNPDTVIVCHWTCSDTDGTYNASVYSTCSVPTPEGSFTPYDQLTQEQVLGWVWANGVDKDATEAAVAAQLQAQINPPVVTPPLPWSAA
tara:strand:- start:3990 stop:4301 length:312 start_codon:yes stop_codon:yes gene_type:complete